jgi:hypothetical protein
VREISVEVLGLPCEVSEISSEMNDERNKADLKTLRRIGKKGARARHWQT